MMARLPGGWTAAPVLQALVWAVLIAVALAFPAAHYLFELQYQRGTLASETQTRAVIIGQRVVANPQLWSFQGLRIEEDLGNDLPVSGTDDRRAVLDSERQVIARNKDAEPLRWPVIRHEEPLYDNGRIAGWVQLERSLRDAVKRTLELALVSVAAAVLLAWLVSHFALRRLRQIENELAHKAFHDDLTGLRNREAFRRDTVKALDAAARDDGRLAVLYIDLDRFKSIHDSFGHEAGDEALRGVAQRLRASVRPGDVVARLSGDEFAILLRNPRAEPMRLAEKLLQAFKEPFSIGGRPWHLGCSVGVALYPDHGGDPDRLLARADSAMLHAKASGRGAVSAYFAGTETSALERIQLEEDLRNALDRQQFLLHYQPLVDLASGQLKGVEALLRWQHPDRGLLLPAEFIPTLEEISQIQAVGRWVLLEACRQMRKWLDAGLSIDLVAVNVSPLQFARQAEFVDVVHEALTVSRLPAAHLQLELTEGTVMANSARSLATLQELRQIGVSLAIDDFGTGYSSLSYLRSFPVSVLKVDRSFVADMVSSPQNASIVKAIVQMAHSLDLRVTAEGIETEEQEQALRDLGCCSGQGFGLGRPMPADALGLRLGPRWAMAAWA